MPKTSSKKYTYAVGRRKSSVATVKLFKGKDSSTVNGKSIKKYFSHSSHKFFYHRPFVVTDTDGKFYFQARIKGGGLVGQTQALSLALARALNKLNPDKFKPLLRPAGLLTVDARVRQRRMVGTGGKARRKKQSPKR